MKNIFCVLNFWAISLGFLSPLIAQDSSPSKAVPGGLSSKKGSGKIFPPNSQFLQVAGHDAYLALPEGVDAGQKTPWLWYCPSDYKLPGKLEQWMMKQCLDNGIAVAGIDVKGDFGTPAGRKIFTAFHKELTEKHGLTRKVCMLARSYGGTQMYNWAAEHPESVACLAGIYPVCNLASYPGMKSAAGKYGMSEEEFAKELKQHNPIDRLAPLAKAKVPIYHNTGDVDTLVPPKDNSFLVEERYKSMGGPMTVTIFEGQGHNYWTGFFEDQAMADFIIKHAKKTASALVEQPPVNTRSFGSMQKSLEPSKVLTYKTVGPRKLNLHLFHPEGFQASDQRPAYVVFHGGGWRSGSPRRFYPYAASLVPDGFVGISAEYRLTGRATTVFDCVKDGRAAIRYIRRHAKDLGIDPEQITVGGGSAGGHVALGTALFDTVEHADEDLGVSCKPNALVLLFSVLDTSPEGYGNKVIGAEWRTISPLHQIRPKMPPTLIFHGDKDSVAPYPTIMAFYKKMRDSKNVCELVLERGGVHGHINNDMKLFDDAANRTKAFLSKQQLGPSRPQKGTQADSIPKVLIIGDSISGGYSKSLIKLLEGKAEVTKLGAVAGYRIQKETFWHSRGEAKYLDFGSAKACIVDFERFGKHLEDTPYDVIHFNFGLNDIFRGRNGAWHNPVDQYAKDLAKIVTLLKANGAKVIWANITPIQANAPHNPEGVELIYNAAAAKVMKKHGIPINNLHSVVTKWEGYAEWKGGNDVHFSGAIYSKLAEQISEKILAELEVSTEK